MPFLSDSSHLQRWVSKIFGIHILENLDRARAIGEYRLIIFKHKNAYIVEIIV